MLGSKKFSHDMQTSVLKLVQSVSGKLEWLVILAPIYRTLHPQKLYVGSSRELLVEKLLLIRGKVEFNFGRL